MRTFLFRGVVCPLGSNLTLPEFIQPIGSIDTDQDDGQIAVKVTDSLFKAKVISLREVGNLGTFVYSYETMFQSYIRAETYVSGKEYNLELIEVVDCDKGDVVNFSHTAKILEENTGRRPFTTTQVLKILHKSKFTHGMLEALNDAISRPRGVAFHCYLALECIRQHFVQSEDGDNKRPSWERMRNSLNIAQTFFDKIKGYADFVRHGDIRSYGPEDRDEFLERTWSVTDRFFVYLDSGVSELDKVKFPPLI